MVELSFLEKLHFAIFAGSQCTLGSSFWSYLRKNIPPFRLGKHHSMLVLRHNRYLIILSLLLDPTGRSIPRGATKRDSTVCAPLHRLVPMRLRRAADLGVSNGWSGKRAKQAAARIEHVQWPNALVVETWRVAIQLVEVKTLRSCNVLCSCLEIGLIIHWEIIEDHWSHPPPHSSYLRLP